MEEEVVEVDWRGEMGDDIEMEEGRGDKEEGLPMVRSLEMVDLPLVRRAWVKEGGEYGKGWAAE